MFKIQKLLLFISCLIASHTGSSQYAKLGDFDVVLWEENYNLRWSDFKPLDTLSNQFTGVAECCINILGYPQKIEGQINMTSINLFIKNKSWRAGDVNNQLLEHEQIHFDISEYHVRLIRYYLSNIEFAKEIEAQSFVDIIIGMCENTQKLFDIESENGNNVKKQNQWRSDIRSKIKSLDDYSKNDYTIEDFKKFEKLIKAKYSSF